MKANFRLRQVVVIRDSGRLDRIVKIVRYPSNAVGYYLEGSFCVRLASELRPLNATEIGPRKGSKQ